MGRFPCRACGRIPGRSFGRIQSRIASWSSAPKAKKHIWRTRQRSQSPQQKNRPDRCKTEKKQLRFEAIIMQTGEKVLFGNFMWNVLDIQEDKALLITEHIIGQRPYHDVYKETTWAECSMRQYLNREFYDGFAQNDKLQICPVTNKNPDNPWYKTKGGDDTQNRIFLLSMEEIVCRYFGDSSEKLYHPKKNQRYWFERKDQNNSRRIARLANNPNQVWWWWTRTPGRAGVKAVYIHGDGNIGIQGNNILKGNAADGMCTGGVRPALWLKL